MSPDPPKEDAAATSSEEDRRARAIRAWSDADSLLFVCFGNVCRSPFAERFVVQRLGEDRRAVSAGHYRVSGRLPPGEAVSAAREFGVELKGHRSQVLSRELVDQADAVFVFDDHNYGAVTSEQPEAAERTHLLGALREEGPLMISDPFGGPPPLYDAVYKQIVAAIEAAERARRGGA